MGKPHGISIIALFIQVWIIILIILNYSPLFCVWYLLTHLSMRVREGELPHDAEMRVYAAHPFYLGDIFHNRQTDVMVLPLFPNLREKNCIRKSKHYLDTYNANERV